jgi:hypothetical protein
MRGGAGGSTEIPLAALEYKTGPNPLEEGRRFDPDAVPGVFSTLEEA